MAQTILLIDDDPDILAVAEAALNRLDYLVLPDSDRAREFIKPDGQYSGVSARIRSRTTSRRRLSSHGVEASREWPRNVGIGSDLAVVREAGAQSLWQRAAVRAHRHCGGPTRRRRP
jgi:hypothetical protein